MGEQAAPPEPGTLVLGRYRLEQRVGAGGMGVVWRAVDETLDMQVALKSISLAGLDPEQRRLALQRTRREARTSAKLRNHTHVVATYDIVDDDDTIWLVLEYVPSQSLGELRRDNPNRLDVSDVAHIGAQVCDALAAAHDKGIVHRDVTPGNILISDDGTAKLTDFGISHANGYQQITEHGTLSGTIAYLAPEVAAGAESTPASDMWSLGATLYHTLEGQPPFGTDDNPLRLLRLVSTGTIRPPTQAGELTSTLQRLLAPDHTRPDAATTRDLLNQLITQSNATTRDIDASRNGEDQTGSTKQLGPLSSEPPDPPARPDKLITKIARHRGAAIAALVLLVGAATAYALLKSSGDTQSPAAAEPPVPPPIAITGNPKDADPCALIDYAALRQFGTPRPNPQGLASGCQASIDTPAEGSMTLEVFFGSPPSTPPAGEKSRIGDLVVTRSAARQGIFNPYCSRTLTLTDQNEIVATAVAKNAGKGTGILCQVAEAGLQTVLTRLREKQITYTPGRIAARSFNNVDACRLLSDDDIRATGAEPTIRVRGYGNWGCDWGTANQRVALLFQVDDATPGSYGNGTVISGHRAWVKDSGTGSMKTCAVYVVSRSAATPQSQSEILRTEVTSKSPTNDRCKQATDLAAKAISRLPAP